MSPSKEKDPTIKTDAPKVSDGAHSADELDGTYRDNPDKPDPATVAQVQDVPEDWPTGQ
jgi:hypothetical protein